MGLRCLTTMHGTRPETVVGIVTIDDTADTRYAFHELHDFGKLHGIPVTVTRTCAELDAAVRAAAADLAIVCGWYSMIAPETLAAVRRGFVGVHNSLLPRYRGAAPIVWAMLNGEAEVGLSMYTLTNSKDDGDIWAQAATSVGPDDYIGSDLARLEDSCEDMVRRTYPLLLDGAIAPVPQNEAAATFGAFRNREDGRIQWTEPAERIYRAIRAQSTPYPGAFTSYDGQRVTVWKAHPFDRTYFGRPGEVVRGPSGDVLVICGDHRALLVEEAQVDSGPRVAGRDALRARTVLGDGR